ncbi:hypothetical protein FDECE_11178 [Fusarium decemcellulare]|nr:hypothetical protein FDECE_11178 [Fusarium decemcellulare]
MAGSSDAMHRAFEVAIRDFKTNLKDPSLYDKILQTTSIEEVYDATDKLQKEQAKSGRLRHLSNIEPFLKRLQEYSRAIDTFVQAKPDVLALIWGPVKLILLWADVLKQSFDAIVDILEEIGSLLPEFSEVTTIFIDNLLLQEFLVLFFRDILDFYVIATKFFSLSRLRIVFEALWPSRRDQIQVVAKHIARHRDLMRSEVRLEEIRTANDFRERELKHFAQTEENAVKQEYANQRAHISPRDYDADLYRFSESVCDGTGKWLFRDPSFKDWTTGSKKPSPILWLKGIPGAVFAFLTYKDSSISALSILHTLIFQLASNSLALKTTLCQSDHQHLTSSLDVATKLLESLLQCAGVVYVIIDGVDEISQTERSKLIKTLLRLGDTCDECRMLLSCRPEADICTALGDRTTDIQVDERNAGSIQAFVNRRMEEWFKERGFFPKIRHQIQAWAAPLASRAKGMFLYVKVIFGIIYHINDVNEIQQELEHLPTSLDDAYGRILQQINTSTDARRKNSACMILGWVGCAPAPMTRYELEQALIVDPDQLENEPRVVSKLNVVQVCGPIIEIVDDYVQFVHFTVKEYIFNPKIEGFISLADMALNLAIRCITYLCQDHHDPSLIEHDIEHNILWGAYRLHHFSSTFWLELIDRYLVFSNADALPENLIRQLELLHETRSAKGYQQTDRSGIKPRAAIMAFHSKEPNLAKVLSDTFQFQRVSSKLDYHLNNPEDWIHLNPLTLPQVSVALHRRLYGNSDEIPFDKRQITRHYGLKRFKCGFLRCQYHRHGFATESSRNSHERHHQKPWTCHISDCEYADTGFISRKMRDRHSQMAHRPSNCSEATSPEVTDEQEVQPLLFDLVEANQVEAVKSLLPWLDQFSTSVRVELAILAASRGSAAILKLFLDEGSLHEALSALGEANWEIFGVLCVRAIDSGSVSTSKLLLNWERLYSRMYVSGMGRSVFASALKKILATIITTESQDLFELWKSSLGSAFGIKGGFENAAHGFTLEGLVAITDNDPMKEHTLLAFWEEYKILETISDRQRKATLGNVARSSCSVNLAQYLLKHGCEVDWVASKAALTPLHHAARKTTEQAARLVEFLLLQGANPAWGTGMKKMEQEPGALGIERWLGVTWDQLVERTAKERKQNKKETN